MENVKSCRLRDGIIERDPDRILSVGADALDGCRNRHHVEADGRIPSTFEVRDDGGSVKCGSGVEGDPLAQAQRDLRLIRVELPLRREHRLYVHAAGHRFVLLLFGMEATASFFWEQGIELPSDGQRLDQLQHLIAAGLGAHILVAQDICQKHRLCAYGGHGYEHIPRQIVPRMRARGFTNGQVDAILVDNPRRAFAIELSNLNTPVEARVPSAVA